MATYPKGQRHDMHETYVEARAQGLAPRECARLAGYSDESKIADLERAGGPIDRRMREVLAEKGMDLPWLADKYKSAFKKLDGGAGPDTFQGMAVMKGLLQMGYLLGLGKNDKPAVAVQINNNGGQGQAGEDDPARARELVGALSELVTLLKSEIGDRKPAGVHGAGAGAADTAVQAHPGVGEAGGDGAQPSGGGGA